MKFERKIFIAVFCTTLAIGSLLIWAAHRYSSERAQDEFISRYSVFTHVLADTLTRLDTDTEALMLNAAQVVAAKDASHGLLSTNELKSMSKSLGITHIFVVAKDGTFIRSTNEDPKSIPNLYSFCGEYRGILDGKYNQDATPVIKPRPEPKPFKFLYIPNATKTRIIEVGVRVDSIAKTLVEAIKADKNVLSMRLYSPDGRSFGQFSAEKVVFDDAIVPLPIHLPNIKDEKDGIHFFSKVTSSHPRCCQCDVAGTSKNGEYYYVLESKISKNELHAVQARMNMMYLLFALGNLIISFFVAKMLSRRLVKNIKIAVTRVREIKKLGSLGERVGLTGPDEVAFLTSEFDNLLDSLEASQKRLVEAEKAESKVQLARIVAHNIRSPIIAIEMMIPQMVMVPEKTLRILSNSVKEIRLLAEKLLSKPETVVIESSALGQMDDLVFLPILLEDIVGQKQIEYSKAKGIQFTLKSDPRVTDAFVKVNSAELRSILSNLINNAVESYGGNAGQVEVSLSVNDGTPSISIIDHGCGIPAEYIEDLGKKQVTFKGERGRGLGLVHAAAMIESWGGRIKFRSQVGRGTIATIYLEKYQTGGSRLGSKGLSI